MEPQSLSTIEEQKIKYQKLLKAKLIKKGTLNSWHLKDD